MLPVAVMAAPVCCVTSSYLGARQYHAACELQLGQVERDCIFCGC